MYFMGIVTIIGSILGAIFLLTGLLVAKSAPQEAAAAAQAVALAVIPYVFFRVLHITKQSADTKAIREAVEAINRRDEANLSN